MQDNERTEIDRERKRDAARRAERRRQRQLQRQKELRQHLMIAGGVIAFLLLVVIVAAARRGHKSEGSAAEAKNETAASEVTLTDSEAAAQAAEAEAQAEISEGLEEAKLYAAQYDYDRAIERIKQIPDYENNETLTQELASIENTKATLVEYPLDEITHVFFHSLLVEPEKSFDGDEKQDDYNQVMTTVDEYNKIIDSMYAKGYVLVSVHDMAEMVDGVMTPKKIMLPEGKIPFVLSQDDVSYYHYMDGDGYATKLIITSDGKVKNEYVETDGSVSVGDYDMVPLLDTFVEEHPDFSYHGRKGILAMTGYDGVLGYRTDTAYQTLENLDEDQKKFLEANPDFDFDAECAEAKRVADAMKANGWEFASHTWGHRNATTATAEQLAVDNEKWETRVAPILGDTDVIIFAFGADIADDGYYSWDNPKFSYFKEHGYDYYCPVDSNQYSVRITDDYFFQGRRNLDGYRMYYNPERVADLFDAEEVLDSRRPLPVPQMED